MLSEIISQVAVNLVGILIMLAFVIPAMILSINFSDKIEKTLIKKNIPKWVVSTIEFFLFIGGILIPGVLGAMTVDYLGLEMFNFSIARFIINLLRDFLHILLSFFY